jgi:hypothetical protein
LRTLCVAAVASGALCAPARAEIYLGGSVLSSEYAYQDVSNGTGNKFFIGYRVDGFPLMLEATKVDVGHPKINNYTDGSGNSLTNSALGFSGSNYSIGYYGSQPRIHLGYWGKIGSYSGESTLKGTFNGSDFHTREKCGGFSWGIGVTYRFTNYLGAMLDLESLTNVKDLPQLDSKHDSNVTLASLGLVLSFPPFRDPPSPHHEARAPVRRQVAIPSPPPPPPPQAAPPVEPAPATSASPAGAQSVSAPALAPGETRTLRAGTVLRARPVAGSPGTALTADTPMRLVYRSESPDGAWWNAESADTRGWVPETELR